MASLPDEVRPESHSARGVRLWTLEAGHGEPPFAVAHEMGPGTWDGAPASWSAAVLCRFGRPARWKAVQDLCHDPHILTGLF